MEKMVTNSTFLMTLKSTRKIRKRREKDRTIQKILKTANCIRFQKNKTPRGMFEEQKVLLFSSKNSSFHSSYCLILPTDGVQQQKLIKARLPRDSGNVNSVFIYFLFFFFFFKKKKKKKKKKK